MAQNSDAPLDPHHKKHDKHAGDHEKPGDHSKGADHKLHSEAAQEWFRQAKEARKAPLQVDKDAKYTVQHGDCLTDIAARRLRTDNEKVDKNSIAKEEKRLRQLNSSEHHSLEDKGKKKDFLADGWHLKIYDSVHTQPKAKPEETKQGPGGSLDVPPLPHIKPDGKVHPPQDGKVHPPDGKAHPPDGKSHKDQPGREPEHVPPKVVKPAADIPDPAPAPRKEVVSRETPPAPLPPERPREEHDHRHPVRREHPEREPEHQREHDGHRRPHDHGHHRRRHPQQGETPAESQPPQERQQPEREPGSDTKNRRHNPPERADEKRENPNTGLESDTPGRANVDRSRFYTHQTDGFSCSAVAMAMMHANHVTGRPPSSDEVAHFKKVAGTTHHGYRGSLADMAEQCRSQGLKTRAYEYKDNFGPQGMQALDKELAMGHSAVARIINPHTGNPHYIFIAGKTPDGRYVIGDPDRKNNAARGHDRPISQQHLYGMMAGRNGFVAGWS